MSSWLEGSSKRTIAERIMVHSKGRDDVRWTGSPEVAAVTTGIKRAVIGNRYFFRHEFNDGSALIVRESEERCWHFGIHAEKLDEADARLRVAAFIDPDHYEEFWGRDMDRPKGYDARLTQPPANDDDG